MGMDSGADKGMVIFGDAKLEEVFSGAKISVFMGGREGKTIARREARIHSRGLLRPSYQVSFV
jgi:hypothetical protein